MVSVEVVVVDWVSVVVVVNVVVVVSVIVVIVEGLVSVGHSGVISVSPLCPFHVPLSTPPGASHVPDIVSPDTVPVNVDPPAHPKVIWLPTSFICTPIAST